MPPDSPNALASSQDLPGPGDLKIKERRSWRTWQLLTVAVIAAVFGMWVNGDTGGGGASSASSGGSGKLPAESSGTAGSSAGSTTTTAAGGATTTTTAKAHKASG